MTVKEYNEWYRTLNCARSFVSCIDHALEKSDENAKMQFKVIGWTVELKEFMNSAIECYAKEMRGRVTMEMEVSAPKFYKKKGDV